MLKNLGLDKSAMGELISVTLGLSHNMHRKCYDEKGFCYSTESQTGTVTLLSKSLLSFQGK